MTVRVSVVIPTLQGNPMTLDSVPEGVETAVVQEGSRSEARNAGAGRTSGDVLVFCDDDVVFDETFFWTQVEASEQGTVIGLEDFEFGLLLTRFMVVRRSDFETLGGFDERLNHMEDTEFCLNALSHGMDLDALPRDIVRHEEHESPGQGRWPTLRNTLYLAANYPRYVPLLINGLLSNSKGTAE